MHHWYHRRAALYIVLLVLEKVSTSSAASIWPAVNETRSAVTLQGRANVDVLGDKYFIPAIAAIGAFVILALICCYWLGWCFNSRRMDRHYSRTAYPTSSRLMIHSLGIEDLRVHFSYNHEYPSYNQPERSWWRRWGIGQGNIKASFQCSKKGHPFIAGQYSRVSSVSLYSITNGYPVPCYQQLATV